MPQPDWYLEGSLDGGPKAWRTPLWSFPFRVGRHEENGLSLRSRQVSQQHAELFERDGFLWLRDLGSTNGTYVNEQRVGQDMAVFHGDVLTFADLEFRLARASVELMPASVSQTLSLNEIKLPSHQPKLNRAFRKMLEEASFLARFQPVVRLADRAVVGYEALGRGLLDGKKASPAELFDLAELLGMETELSTALRLKAVEEARGMPPSQSLFLNTHPAELRQVDRLRESISVLRTRFPELSLVLEIHEAAITDLTALRRLSSELKKIGVGIAFDDFGTGQARLVELTHVAPQYVKFDRIWIQNLHEASKQRLEMVRTLTRLVVDIGAIPLAEGVESVEEANACTDIGFELVQGFYFGRPEPMADVTAPASSIR